MSAVASPYTLDTKFKQAGWVKNFEVSDGGHNCVRVPGAPPLGSSPGGKLFVGHFTKPDGTRVIIESNMDRSMTSIVISPLGVVLHTIISDTLIEAEAEVIKLGVI
jgi:hypothetical protein